MRVYLQGAVQLPEGGVLAHPGVGRLRSNYHGIIFHVCLHMLDHALQGLWHFYSGARQAVFQTLDLQVNFTL